MTTTMYASPAIDTLADLVRRLGDIPLWRIRFKPHPGSATEADVVAVQHQQKRLCELVDGVVVEKPTGYNESLLAVAIATDLRNFVKYRQLGKVSGEGRMISLFPGLVRIPDVAYVSNERLAAGSRHGPVPHLIPDLVVEVLSAGNTKAEIAVKRREYFEAGVRLFWSVDPQARTIQVFTDARKFTELHEPQSLDGGEVLPGFAMPLTELFAELDEVP